MLNELPGKEIKTMMDVANVQDSPVAGVLREGLESPVAFAQTSANCHTPGGQQ